MGTRALQLCLTTAVTAAALTTLAAPASAHVTADGSGTPTRGGFTVIDLKVPTESETASTTKVALTFSTPLPFAAPATKDGWTAVVTKGALPAPVITDDGTLTQGVTGIAWTATGKGTAPGFFEEFRISAGPLPDQAELAMPTVQTYSDGTVASWVEPTPAGGAQPDHPAPVIALAAGGEGTGTGATGAMPGRYAADSADDTDVLGIIGVILGGLALVGAGVALARTRRPRPEGSDAVA